MQPAEDSHPDLFQRLSSARPRRVRPRSYAPREKSLSRLSWKQDAMSYDFSLTSRTSVLILTSFLLRLAMSFPVSK